MASAQSLGLSDCPRGLAWTLWPRGLTAGRLHVLAVPGLWWMRRKRSFLPLGSERENHIEGVSSAVSGAIPRPFPEPFPAWATNPERETVAWKHLPQEMPHGATTLSVLSFNYIHLSCVSLGWGMPWHMCGGQRIPYRSWFSASTVWVQGTGLKPSDLAASPFTP